MPRHSIGLVLAIAYGVSLSACQRGIVIEEPRNLGPCCFVEFSFEVINGASDRVRLQVAMMRGFVRDPEISTDDANYRSTSGILNFNSGERSTFSIRGRFVDANHFPDNFYVGSVGTIRFYSSSADTVIASYIYEEFGCGVGLGSCDGAVDDTLVFHRASDGTLERLFVESPDRPFYLERDRDDPDLGRLVITFSPRADQGGVLSRTVKHVE